VETAPGLELPGYQMEELPASRVDHGGAVFPPRQPDPSRQLTSDRIAADIRRRDLLQNEANEWCDILLTSYSFIIIIYSVII